MTMSRTNPFTPASGTAPQVLAGRDRIMADLMDGLSNGPGDPNRSTILVGPRGSGKTVLLAEASRKAEALGWIAVYSSARPTMLDWLVERIETKAAATAKKSGPRAAGAKAAAAEASKPQESWQSRLSSSAEALSKRNVGLLIALDDVSFSQDMADLAAMHQQFVMEGRNVALVMAGETSKVGDMLEHDDMSFLRRSFQRPLSALSLPESKSLLKRTAKLGGKTFEADALEMAASASGGSPFMAQLIGYHSFSMSDGKEMTVDDVRDGMEAAKADFGNMVLGPLMRNLSDMDIRFLLAMAVDEGESRISDVAERLGSSVQSVSQNRRRLVAQGLIAQSGRGRMVMNAPLLREWLLDRYEAEFEFAD